MMRFGPYEVDFSIAEVRKSGVRLRVPEQQLRVLQALVDRPGELITRDELRQLLWPGDTFVAFDHSLNVAVAKLRQLLNDSADRPLYIETIARKGYRFIAPVIKSEAERSPAEEPQIAPSQIQPARHGRAKWAWAGASAVVCIGLAWTIWPTPSADSGRRIVALDLDVGTEVSQAAISTDGDTLVFVESGQLAVRKLDQTRITPLAGTEGASSPFFSPDGRWVGYFAAHQLRKVPIDGGESLVLCQAPFDRGGKWTESGEIIASLSTSGELSSIPASGGEARPFSTLRGEAAEVTVHRSPVALPGGKGTLFVSGTGVANGSIRVLLPGGATAKTLVQNSSTARYLASGYLLFNRGATVFAAPIDLDRLELTGAASPVIAGVAVDHFRGADFNVSAAGTVVYRRSASLSNHAVTWLDSSGVKDRVIAETGPYTSPRLSPDGMRLAVVSEDEIWIYDLVRKRMTQLTSGLEVECCPVWTPNGEYIAFVTKKGITVARSDGTGTMEVMASAPGISAVPWSFSPDGAWLAFHRNEPQTSYDLWAAPVNLTGGTLRLGRPQPLLTQPGVQAAPTISPDGKWLAYGSNESGNLQLYVIPFSPQTPPRDGKWLVAMDGARSPRWSHDGREIFFRSPDDHLMSVSITAEGNSLRAGTPRQWSPKRLAAIGIQPNFDIAPDGKRVVALLDVEDSRPDETHLRVLLNLNDDLRRRRLMSGNE